MSLSAAAQIADPFAACPRMRNVLGYGPWPQILKELKSLYQSPSGTSGPDSILKPKLVEIRYADRPVVHPFHQMPAYRNG